LAPKQKAYVCGLASVQKLCNYCGISCTKFPNQDMHQIILEFPIISVFLFDSLSPFTILNMLVYAMLT